MNDTNNKDSGERMQLPELLHLQFLQQLATHRQMHKQDTRLHVTPHRHEACEIHGLPRQLRELTQQKEGVGEFLIAIHSKLHSNDQTLDTIIVEGMIEGLEKRINDHRHEIHDVHELAPKIQGYEQQLSQDMNDIQSNTRNIDDLESSRDDPQADIKIIRGQLEAIRKRLDELETPEKAGAGDPKENGG